MVDSTLPSSVTGGLTKIPLDPPAEVFGRLWQQAVEEFICRAQLSNDEKASICRHLTPEEAFNFTKRRWNNLNEKQLSRHQKGQRAVDTVLGIFSLIDGALGLAQVVGSTDNSGISYFRHSLLSPSFPEPSNFCTKLVTFQGDTLTWLGKQESRKYIRPY